VMRVMPRLLKLVSSVLSGRNHSGRIVGNPSFTGLWKGCPFIRPELGLMSTRTSTHTESPSIPNMNTFAPDCSNCPSSHSQLFTEPCVCRFGC
jgi:hypothetical protein